MGTRIFMLAVNQVWQNRAVALRISAFWYGLVFILSLVGEGLGDELIGILVSFLLVVVMFYGLSMIAIGWHRFVLWEDEPQGLLVFEQVWPVWRYVRATLKLFLVILLVLLLPMILTALLFAGAPESAASIALWLSMPLLGYFVIWLFLRMGLILPAIAVETQMTLKESFALTRPIADTLFVPTLLILLMQLVPSLLALPALLLDGWPVLSAALLFAVLPLSLVVGWINTMVGIGLLTVLYGHLCENRPI